MVNLVVMGAGAWYSYQQAPPVPEEVTGPAGEPIATDEQVQQGKTVFQANGLMNHGSILGNGAYYGVDYTAYALARKTHHMRAYYAEQRYDAGYAALTGARQAVIDQRVERDLDDTGSETVQYSSAEAYAHRQVRAEFVDLFGYFEPGQFIPVHAPDSDVTVAVQSGTAVVRDGEAEHTVRPGDVVVVEAGTDRGVRARGDERLETLLVTAPRPTDADHDPVRRGLRDGTFDPDRD